MALCKRCANRDTERRVHLRAMDEYHEEFYAEYVLLVAEYDQLCALMCEVFWYNFETAAKAWREPWPLSLQESHLSLFGARYELRPSRGRTSLKATFPVYYHGTLRDAPRVPPELLLTELSDAREAMLDAANRVTAPYDYAPGGDLYAKHVRESVGARIYEEYRLSDRSTNGRGPRGSADEAGERGLGLWLGDPMERAAETSEDEATAIVLG